MPTAQSQQTIYAGVGQDSNGDGRVRASVDQPVIAADTPRTHEVNTKLPRTKKRSTRRRLSQLATWVESPIVLQIKDLARSHKPLPQRCKGGSILCTMGLLQFCQEGGLHAR